MAAVKKKRVDVMMEAYSGPFEPIPWRMIRHAGREACSPLQIRSIALPSWRQLGVLGSAVFEILPPNSETLVGRVCGLELGPAGVRGLISTSFYQMGDA